MLLAAIDSQLAGIIVQAIVTIVTTIGGVAIAYIALRNKMLDKLEEVEVKVDEAAVNIQKVHVATNSMKDELVAATRKFSLREGADIERQRVATEQAAVERGKVEQAAEDREQALDPVAAPEKLAEQIKENKENADDMAEHLRDKP